MLKALAVLLVAGAIAPATGMSAPASAAENGSVGIRLTEAPTDRRDDPRAKLYVIDHVKPGTTIRRKLEVSNQSPTTQTITVYPAAAEIKDGSFFPAEERTPNELSSWTSVSDGSLPLAAGRKQVIEATIAVPANASSGERYAVIWAEVRSAKGTGVNQVNRVGVRIYLSVGAGGEPASDFSIDTLTANRLPDGQPVVYALVHNTGGRALDMSGSLRLSNGPGGLSAGPFTAKLGTTLGIKQTEPVTVLLDKALPAGPWKARIELESGLQKRIAEATLTFPDAAGPGTEVSATPVVLTEKGDGGLPLIAIGAGAGGLGLLGIGLALLARRGNKRRTAGGKHSR